MATKLQKDIHILCILKNMVEAHNSSMLQRFMDFYFCDQLHQEKLTFCLALHFLSVCLFTILMAEIFLEFIFVASKQ